MNGSIKIRDAMKETFKIIITMFEGQQRSPNTLYIKGISKVQHKFQQKSIKNNMYSNIPKDLCKGV